MKWINFISNLIWGLPPFCCTLTYLAAVAGQKSQAPICLAIKRHWALALALGTANWTSNPALDLGQLTTMGWISEWWWLGLEFTFDKWTRVFSNVGLDGWKDDLLSLRHMPLTCRHPIAAPCNGSNSSWSAPQQRAPAWQRDTYNCDTLRRRCHAVIKV